MTMEGQTYVEISAVKRLTQITQPFTFYRGPQRLMHNGCAEVYRVA
jgi:hypothetical protein